MLANSSALPLIAALFATASLVGCTDLQSSKLQTSGMTASLSVTADGTGSTTATGQLNVDTNVTDFVELSPGDTFSSTTGSQTQSMGESDVLGIVSYSASFSGADAAGTSYKIALNRAAPNTSAPSSTVTLPAPFSITAPAASASVSRASDLVINYGPSGGQDPLSYTLSGDCIDGVTNSVSGDPGTITISKNTITQTKNSATNCQVTVSITRQRTGTLDPAYSGGSILGRQTRQLTITSTP